ncbi:MAG: hypothetical protein K2M70_09905 [Lachnospiraceae bacterium]|nr:hypothetical protein [Lachnospiraceae bacterium]
MNGMVNWKNINSNPMATLSRNQRLIDVLLAKGNAVSKGQRDLFIRSDNSVSEMGLYTPAVHKVAGKVSDAILDMINFEYWDGGETVDSFIFGGVEYFKEDVPDISLERCEKATAENNAIVFRSGKYYQFTDDAGKAHIVACSYGRMTQPRSNTERGVVDDRSFEIAQFWNKLSKNGTFIGLYYSEETQRKLLSDAGISEGFFSVQVGENKQEYFYSNGTAGTVVPKWRYDSTYQTFMTRNEFVFEDYEPGAVFQVGGKDYVLSEEKKLDLPYGVDIYDVKWPPRKQA